MFQPRPAIAELQRNRGEVRVDLVRKRGRTCLSHLYQSGAAKAFLPRVEGDAPEVVLVNTAGGLTGGDRLEIALTLGPGTCATATTQAAERAYASAAGEASIRLRLQVGDGGRLDWLPQETILFQASALHRDTTIALTREATCLFAETIVLGRAAMGETLTRVRLSDRRLVSRDGYPVLVEPLQLGDDVMADRGNPALLRGARAFATIALVDRGAEDAAAPVRAVLDEPGVEAAASGWDGKCLVRVLGRDGWPVRRQVARVLAVLRGRPLPRVWQLQEKA